MSTKSIYIIGGLLRLTLLMIPQVITTLTSLVGVSTPMNSYKSLQEAFYYLEHGINLYDGGVVHHTPILVVVMSFFNDWFPLPMSVLYVGVDLWICSRLVAINRWYNEHQTKRLGRKVIGASDSVIVGFYMLNPLLVLTTLSQSTLVFGMLFVVESISQIVLEHNLYRGMMSLALASYLTLSPLYLLVPVLTLAHAILKMSWQEVYVVGSGIFVGSLMLLIMASFAMTSSFQFVYACYGTALMFDKITPNLGLWWYLFTEMFEYFTPFYKGLFNIYGGIFIIPITMRFWEVSTESTQSEVIKTDDKSEVVNESNKSVEEKSPKSSLVAIGDSFLAVVLSYFWISFTKSYPSYGDLAFGLSFLPIFSSTILPYCRYSIITALILLGSLLLGPIFYYSWIVLGSGNSNFFYSITLFYGGVHIAIIMDLIWAKLSYDYQGKNRGNSSLTQI